MEVKGKHIQNDIIFNILVLTKLGNSIYGLIESPWACENFTKRNPTFSIFWGCQVQSLVANCNFQYKMHPSIEFPESKSMLKISHFKGLRCIYLPLKSYLVPFQLATLPIVLW
jgi:hypothetical protein